MTSPVHRSLPISGAPGATCAGCGSELAPDQRYCLNCGERRPDAVPDALDALRAAATPLPVAAAAGAGAARRAALPIAGSDAALRVACAVFALTLGLGAYAAAATTSHGPSGSPQRVALAMPEGDLVTPAVPVTPAEPAPAAPADELEAVEPPAGEESAAATSSEPPAAEQLAQDEPDDEPEDETPAAGDDDEPAEPAATTPSLEHVVVVALPAESYERRFDPSGPSPYVANDLTASGALLSRVHALRAGTLPNTIALVSGQGPNPDTEAGCATPAPLLPGTIGEHDQVAGRGCVYPADAFTIADQLGGRDRVWRVYLPPAASDAPPPPACPPAGEPFAALRNPFLAFAGVSADAAACASHLAPAERFAADLSTKATMPALSYVIAPDEPAALDGFLRGTVTALRASPAYARSAAILVADGAAPSDGTPADSSACCTGRPWYGGQASGGGRVGAILLSPFVKGGTVVDAPLDELDLLRTISDALGLRPLGFAGHESVVGVPREAWSDWPEAAAAG